MTMDLSTLNPMQREAVTRVQGPLLVLAGAGSGKTRVITSKVAHLIFDHHVSPGRIMALTFTNKAAREMASRIESLIRMPVRGLLIGTFHSICARLLRQEGVMGGRFTIFDTEDQKKIIRGALEKLGLSESRHLSPGDVQARISGLKNRMVGPDLFERRIGSVFDEQFAAVYRKYEAEKTRNNGLDFDDLLLETVGLFRSRAEVLEKYCARVEYLLVDEYQDTNLPQYELVRLLSGQRRNITVVGDDDQAIYSWRGADIRNILEFEKAFPETAIVRLEQNYRSTRVILEAANTVIRHNKSRKGKALWTLGPAGDLIDVTFVRDEQEEAHEIVSRVRSRGLTDAAVFYRTNAQSRPVEDALRNAGLPYIIVGGVRFYERREIKDLLAYLRLIANPGDSLSLSRIINVPRRGIGERTEGTLAACAEQQGISAFEALLRLETVEGLSSREKASLASFRDLMRPLMEKRADTGMTDFIRLVAEKSGLLESLRSSEEEQAAERAENISEFVNAAGEYAERAENPSLEGFLEEVALMTDIDEVKEGETAPVTLMTLHASKGLEFDHVFITGLEDGLFPFTRAAEEGDVEEERRLFYVGLTRARKWAGLFHAAQRRRFGALTSAFPSPFLLELPEHCVRRTDRVSFEASPAPRRAYSPGPEREDRTRRMPRYEDYSQEEGTLRAGDRVRHPLWGSGTVVSLSGFSENTRAVIRFDNDAVKKVVLKYARLEPAAG